MEASRRWSILSHIRIVYKFWNYFPNHLSYLFVLFVHWHLLVLPIVWMIWANVSVCWPLHRATNFFFFSLMRSAIEIRLLVLVQSIDCICEQIPLNENIWCFMRDFHVNLRKLTTHKCHIRTQLPRPTLSLRSHVCVSMIVARCFTWFKTHELAYSFIASSSQL